MFILKFFTAWRNSTSLEPEPTNLVQPGDRTTQQMDPPAGHFYNVIEATIRFGIPHFERYMAFSVSKSTIIFYARFRERSHVISCPVQIHAAALSHEDRASLQLSLNAIRSSVPDIAWYILNIEPNRRLIVLDEEGNPIVMETSDNGV